MSEDALAQASEVFCPPRSRFGIENLTWFGWVGGKHHEEPNPEREDAK